MGTRSLLVGSALAALTLTSPAAAEPWSRAYVIEWIEAAAHYGGGDSPVGPGTDCPTGTAKMDLKKVLTTSYRTAEDAQRMITPGGGGGDLIEGMRLRGPNKEDVYKNPTSVPDVGFPEVQGKVAEGFNLDGEQKTGFTSPSGEKGIDNRFYKAWGCWEAFRGPAKKGSGATYHNDEMRNGKRTVLLLISGAQSPQNDDAVTLGIYASKDKVVKDASGQIAPDYSYRIADQKPFTNVLKAKVKDSVLELTEPQDMRLNEASFMATLSLYEGRVRIKLEDGPIQGMIGGYRPIQEAFITWTVAGPQVELVTHGDLTAAWYAIQRNADARPDPVTKKNTAISTAVRFWAVPAHVIKPDGSAPAVVAEDFSKPVQTSAR